MPTKTLDQKKQTYLGRAYGCQEIVDLEEHGKVIMAACRCVVCGAVSLRRLDVLISGQGHLVCSKCPKSAKPVQVRIWTDNVTSSEPLVKRPRDFAAAAKEKYPEGAKVYNAASGKGKYLPAGKVIKHYANHMLIQWPYWRESYTWVQLMRDKVVSLTKWRRDKESKEAPQCAG